MKHESEENIENICKECSDERLKQFQETFDFSQVKVGDFVKTAFTDGEEVEHMWVEVMEIGKDYCKGKVRNEPFSIKGIEYGDFVKVKKSKIEALQGREI